MKITSLYLLTINLEETENFYNDILDIPTYKKTNNEVSFWFGETIVYFKKSELNAEYHIAFEIPKNQLIAAYNWTKSRTAVLPVNENSDFSHFEFWGAQSFYFYDNNSNLLELIVRSELDNASDEIFDSSSILYASEIGIVTDNVSRMAEKIIENYPLLTYSKQPAQEKFVVIGEETGLLVLVDENRNWYPTDKKANSFPLKIVFEKDAKKHELFID